MAFRLSCKKMGRCAPPYHPASSVRREDTDERLQNMLVPFSRTPKLAPPFPTPCSTPLTIEPCKTRNNQSFRESERFSYLLTRQRTNRYRVRNFGPLTLGEPHDCQVLAAVSSTVRSGGGIEHRHVLRFSTRVYYRGTVRVEGFPRPSCTLSPAFLSY